MPSRTLIVLLLGVVLVSARPLPRDEEGLASEFREALDDLEDFNSAASSREAEARAAVAAASLVGDFEDFPTDDSPISDGSATNVPKFDGFQTQLSQSRSVLRALLRKAHILGGRKAQGYGEGESSFASGLSSRGRTWSQFDWFNDFSYDSSPGLFSSIREAASKYLGRHDIPMERGSELEVRHGPGEFSEDAAASASTTYDLPVEPVPADGELDPFSQIAQTVVAFDVVEKARGAITTLWKTMNRERHYI